MSDACIVAVGAVSALGAGRAAYAVAEVGKAAPVAIARDEILERAGLARPFAARVADVEPPGCDRATWLLDRVFDQVSRALDERLSGWRQRRIGIAVGTSSGGMLTAERFFAARAAGDVAGVAAACRGATYFSPLDDAVERAGLSAVAHRTQILAACAASTVALGVGLRWLDRGACDLVLAGGYDALSLFVASGFEALRATTASQVRPFRVGRDGMALGEGAGLVALVREVDAAGLAIVGRIAGFGASTDAVHITAPDRTGSGLCRAARAALADAGVAPASVGLVSAHGTATPYNDAMESKAVAAALDGGAPPIHPFKAQIGHTLGAAGVLEVLAVADALGAGVAPAAAGDGPLDPEAPATMLPVAERRSVPAALKLSAAFGGANAALVLTAEPSGRVPRAPRRVRVAAAAHVTDVDLGDLVAATGVARDRLARLDAVSRLGLGAVARLAAAVGVDALRGAGIVAGHALATLDTNEGFDRKKRERGPRFVDPRVFPATSPNAVAGECAIPFGLTGPGFAVSAGLGGAGEALARASELVAAGDADRIVVVGVDDGGPAAAELCRVCGWSAPERGAVAVLLDAQPGGVAAPLDPSLADGVAGHRALLGWLVDRGIAVTR